MQRVGGQRTHARTHARTHTSRWTHPTVHRRKFTAALLLYYLSLDVIQLFIVASCLLIFYDFNQLLLVFPQHMQNLPLLFVLFL